jgi:xyloglucan-specific exo-beta-1,4-glucanase
MPDTNGGVPLVLPRIEPASDANRFWVPPSSSAVVSRRDAILTLAGVAASGVTARAERQKRNSAPRRSAFPGEGTAQVAYRWQNVRIGGGGFVTGIVTHPTSRIIYARTDVGGAYRLDADTDRWTPITDWVGGPDWPLSGIESLAVDPLHSDRVYIAAGMYTQRWSPDAVMLRSDDRGRTFRPTRVPFKCGGNEAGRFNGERLAVDPNAPEILFFGSRLDGIWKSTDASLTWRRVRNFAVPRGTDGVGVVTIVFHAESGHRGEPTPVIFAAVSRPWDYLYRSHDAGRSWRAIAGGPRGLRPNHAVIGPDGWMYLSFGREAGPNTMTDGAVWKYHPASGQWKDITPLSPITDHRTFGYGTVAVDARRPGAVMAGTFCRWSGGDIIFRSTDGGENWRPISPRHGDRWDTTEAPWLNFHRAQPMVTNWIGSLQIDPHDSNRVWYTTGWGVFRSDDVTRSDEHKPTHWAFYCDGFEETVINDLASPSRGPHLLSAMGDISGFRHDDLRVSPPQGFYPHGCGSNTSIAVAALRPEFAVRTFGGERVNMALSTTGGRYWQFLPTQPPGAQYGRAAVNCNGTAIIWTPSDGAWSPANRPPYFTHDRGRSWHACRDIGHGLVPCADPINSRIFYAFEPQHGHLLQSANGGARFSIALSNLPHSPGELRATMGRTQDLWLACGAGVYHMDLRHRHTQRCHAIEAAEHIGFGRGAPGRSYPAVYVVGTCGGIYGFYRSVDAGTTWARINDFEHQFFSISCIIGDPRIFGRVYLGTSGRGIIFGDII